VGDLGPARVASCPAAVGESGDVALAAVGDATIEPPGDCGMEGKCGTPSFPGTMFVFRAKAPFGFVIAGVGSAVIINGLIVPLGSKSVFSSEM
jgi:hypothetical protein